MDQTISEELINKIRSYVRQHHSKIEAANYYGLSYDVVLFYTKDITLKSRTKDVDYSGIYGKSLNLLIELIQNGYVFPPKNYTIKHYIKLKTYFPNIRRIKIHGKMIYFFDDKSKVAFKALIEVLNKKVMSYQELKQIEMIFNAKLKIVEHTTYIGKKLGGKKQ